MFGRCAIRCPSSSKPLLTQTFCAEGQRLKLLRVRICFDYDVSCLLHICPSCVWTVLKCSFDLAVRSFSFICLLALFPLLFHSWGSWFEPLTVWHDFHHAFHLCPMKTLSKHRSAYLTLNKMNHLQMSVLFSPNCHWVLQRLQWNETDLLVHSNLEYCGMFVLEYYFVFFLCFLNRNRSILQEETRM